MVRSILADVFGGVPSRLVGFRFVIGLYLVRCGNVGIYIYGF